MPKNIVITGASRGVGHQAARYLAERGHQVLAVARSEERLDTLQKQSENIMALPVDLTMEQELNQLKTTVTNNFAPLDVLVNCAGALINKTFEDLETKDWQKMLDVNFLAPVHLIQDLLPAFNKEAHIVNISSMAGYQGSAKFPGLAAYASAKGALSILTECVAAEFADRNISCNALCLGMVQTEMLEEAFPGAEAPVTASEMGKYVGNFSVNGHQFYNGQILPVNRQNPS